MNLLFTNFKLTNITSSFANIHAKSTKPFAKGAKKFALFMSVSTRQIIFNFPFLILIYKPPTIPLPIPLRVQHIQTLS